MWYYEVIFAKSFKVNGRVCITTVTEVVQSGKFKEMDADLDANNKVERHPLAKAGWYWSPPQLMSRQEVEAFREDMKKSERLFETLQTA
jgi:hypothetical protein